MHVSVSLIAVLLSMALVVPIYAGSCDYGDPAAPKTTLPLFSSVGTVSGAGIQINPKHPYTGVVSEQYLRSEVRLIREMPFVNYAYCSSEAGIHDDPWYYDYHLSLNISECDCTHTKGSAPIPTPATGLRNFVKVNISCPAFPTLDLSLEVSTVDTAFTVPHDLWNDSSSVLLDRYEPNSLKFNVTATGWPWTLDPSSLITIFMHTDINAATFQANTTTTNDSISVLIYKDLWQISETIQRGFVADDYGFLTPIGETSFGPLLLDSHLELFASIPLCYMHKPLDFKPTKIQYDPTLAAVFLGDPPQTSPTRKTDSKIINIVVPAVVVPVVVLVAVFTVVAYYTPAVKNFFRPYRNPYK